MTTYETIVIVLAIVSMVISTFSIQASVAAKRSALAAEAQARAAAQQAEAAARSAQADEQQLGILLAEKADAKRIAMLKIIRQIDGIEDAQKNVRFATLQAFSGGERAEAERKVLRLAAELKEASISLPPGIREQVAIYAERALVFTHPKKAADLRQAIDEYLHEIAS